MIVCKHVQIAATLYCHEKGGRGDNSCLFSAQITPLLFPTAPLFVIVCSVFQVARGGESSCLESQAQQGASLKRAEVWVITELIEPLLYAAAPAFFFFFPLPFWSAIWGLFAAQRVVAKAQGKDIDWAR